MPRVLLLHTNREYAMTLARAVTASNADYEVEVVSREPVRQRLSHLLRGEHDLVQTDELLVNGVLGLVGSIFRETPLVVSIRGWADYTNAHGQYSRFREKFIRLRAKFVLRQANAIIFLSERTRLEFEKQYSVANSSVVGRPIDVEHYRSGTAEDTGVFELISVTNFRYEEKLEGIKTILLALIDLFNRYDNLVYTVAGGGAYLSELRRFIDDYPHADRVNILGFREDVPDLLDRADAFVYVSYLDAYPTVVLEAQAAGLPVVGGNAVGVPAVVGDAGEVVSPTPEGLQDALERIIADNDYRATLAAKSEEKMATYNERCARRHVDIWDRVLDRSDYS
jgi:glycosyltransferase involved in cell wall biosynthesis